jgi:hypothetical protein
MGKDYKAYGLRRTVGLRLGADGMTMVSKCGGRTALQTRALLLGALWILSLVAAAHVGARAQSQDAPVFAGGDIGFKPISTRDGLIFGTIQIRVNGTWRPVVVVDGGPMKSVVKPLPAQ